jgi:hypothetical protein
VTEQLQQDEVAVDRRGIRIDVDQLSRQVRLRNRNQLTLLDAVSFSVSAGELVAIVGPSGAGKTTLLEAVAGIAPATSGSVRFDGVDVYENLSTFRSVLGYVPQDDIIHADLPLERTLRYAARLRLPSSTTAARALQVVEQTGTRGRCVDPRARLADLLVRQGRFEEAEQLLPGADGDGWTVRARAELHLARGEPGAAAVVLERRLRQITSESLLAVTVLDLLVQARLGEGNLEAATEAARALEALGASADIDRVSAYAERAWGRVASAARAEGGLERLERAIAVFARLGMGLEVGRTRLDLARALRGGRPASRHRRGPQRHVRAAHGPRQL